MLIIVWSYEWFRQRIRKDNPAQDMMRRINLSCKAESRIRRTFLKLDARGMHLGSTRSRLGRPHCQLHRSMKASEQCLLRAHCQYTSKKALCSSQTAVSQLYCCQSRIVPCRQRADCRHLTGPSNLTSSTSCKRVLQSSFDYCIRKMVDNLSLCG